MVDDIELVGQLTGHGSENRTDKRWQVMGTDLGIVWESRPGEVAVAFGDTIGAGPRSGNPDWRSNALAHSTDRNLADGMRFDSMVSDSRCHAVELLTSRKVSNYEITTVPTSGFALGDRQYLSYMSIARWSREPGRWWTNYGGIAWSDDGGSTWTKSQHAQWHNFFGLGKFQVTAMVPHGDHVYMFGTPNGRFGSIGLARVPLDQVLNKSAYQYWMHGDWAPVAETAPGATALGENTATPIADGIAGEISVRFDTGTQLWQMSYLDVSRGAIVLRNAASPQGIWSAPATLIDHSGVSPGLWRFHPSMVDQHRPVRPDLGMAELQRAPDARAHHPATVTQRCPCVVVSRGIPSTAHESGGSVVIASRIPSPSVSTAPRSGSGYNARKRFGSLPIRIASA